MPVEPAVRIHNEAVVACLAAVESAFAMVKAEPTLTLADAESAIVEAIRSLRTDS